MGARSFKDGAILALLGEFFAARSIIEVAPRPHKLTGQAQLCLGKRTGRSLAVLSMCKVTPPASPVRYLAETAAIADRDLTTPKTGGVVLGCGCKHAGARDAGARDAGASQPHRVGHPSERVSRA